MKTKAFLKSRDLRKRVEMRFAHLKTHHRFERMRLRGIRRVPVVDAAGKLSGVVCADDLLEFLAEEMGELSRISSWQQAHERRMRH